MAVEACYVQVDEGKGTDTKESAAGRLRSILWLRVIATMLVCLYHAARFFDDSPSDISVGHVGNIYAAEAFGRFLTQWHMPLFFLLAGYSLRLSLGKGRGPLDVLSERIQRLLIPFAFGILFVCIPQAYLVQIYHRGWKAMHPWLFVVEFFTGGRFTWAHLWFLLLLFIFTVTHTPLFVQLMRAPQYTVSRPAALSLSAVLLALPFAASYSFGVGLFTATVSLLLLLITIIGRSEQYHIALSAASITLLAFTLTFMFDIASLAWAWSLMYSILCAVPLLTSTVSARNGGLIAAAGLVAAAFMHIVCVSDPNMIPVDVDQILGLRVADLWYMVAHFTPFVSIGFAAASFGPLIASSAPLVSASKWLGIGVLAAIPLAGFTLPQHSGYVILVGNFPTYTDAASRMFFHTGCWMWLCILNGLAYLVCAQSPNEAVERYLARASMTVYTTHILWNYVAMFAGRWVQSVVPESVLLVPFVVFTLSFLLTFAFHHFVVLRSPRLQFLLGVK